MSEKALNTLIWYVAQEAYRHGSSYYRTYRHVGRFHFKNPVVCCSYALERLPFEDHVLLEKVYKHAFRQGLKVAGGES